MGRSPQPSPTPGNNHDKSTNSCTEDSYDDEIDSFDQNSKNVSLNSTKSADVSRRIIYGEREIIFRERKQTNYNKVVNAGDGFSPNSTFGNTPEARRKLETSSVKSSTEDPSFIYILVVIGSILLGCLVFFLFSMKAAPKRIECPQFKELTKDFTNQDTLLWKSLKVGIENVVNQTPAQPSVFLLAYNDAQTSKSVMTKILNATANCMKSRDPIKLEGGSFVTEAMIKDYGEIITAYRKRLEHEGILYVEDVHKIPAQAAQAFHSICDTITPLVERSVIFFTMYVSEYDEKMSPQEIHRLVETQLENNWIDINHNTLKALIGRVTDQVFLLHSENSLNAW